MGLLVTFILGLFIILGSIIVFISKNDNSFVEFSIGLAFSVIIMLIIFDLSPEIYEIFSEENTTVFTIIIMVLTSGLGLVILKIFDKFIPDHEGHNHSNLAHIGLIASIALVLHNILEGMAVYNAVETSIKTGSLIAIGVGLHNVPLGMIITSSFYKANNSKTKTMLKVSFIALSTFIGGIFMALLGDLITETFEGITLGITLGMLIYIALFELLPKITETKKKSKPVYGIIIGILLILLSMYLGSH